MKKTTYNNSFSIYLHICHKIHKKYHSLLSKQQKRTGAGFHSHTGSFIKYIIVNHFEKSPSGNAFSDNRHYNKHNNIRRHNR